MPHEDEQDLQLLTTVPTNTEAVILAGDLEAVGIQAIQRSSSHVGGIFGTPLAVDIYVGAGDLDRARAVLAEPVSDEDLLDAEEEADRGH